MEWIICLIFMTICTVTDIKKKEVPIAVIVLFGSVAVLYVIIGGEKKWMEILYSIMPGAFLLLLGLCTRESIGYGDGFAAMVSGLLTGWKGCVTAIITGLLLSSVFALALLICKRAKGKSRIPFLPFLAIGLGVFYIVQKEI